MITYMDRTFCMSDCTNAGCPRYAHEHIIEGAQQFGLPIAWANLSVECPAYIAPNGEEDASLQGEME